MYLPSLYPVLLSNIQVRVGEILVITLDSSMVHSNCGVFKSIGCVCCNHPNVYKLNDDNDDNDDVYILNDAYVA